MKSKNETIEDIDSTKDNPYAIEPIDESSDLKEPFDPKKIDITVKPLLIDSLIKRMKSNPPRIDLNTEFQRRGNLWGETSQSRLIESLMVRIPIPAFYFDGTDDNNWKIVDGLQRLTTLKRFIIDKELILQDLEFLALYNGCDFDELPPYQQGRIEETQITAYIINPGTPEDVKYNIFKRVNTGGLVLKPQEIRHALNQGIPADFIKNLTKLPEFIKATQNSLFERKRMEDEDFVIRFIAFYHDYENYQSDLDDYLNRAMGNLKKISEQEREQIKNDFIKAMDTSYKIFGEYAFMKRFDINDHKRLLNKALFDTWSVNLAHLSIDNIANLILKKEIVNNRFIELMNRDTDFVNSITTGTGKITAVKKRFSEIKKLINECLK
ncbi:MAG: DUF262 domain-containing protein [Acidobacteria bacterium]|nr:DUF262 domain-containing protein [Acidobacteriota bacterium]